MNVGTGGLQLGDLSGVVRRRAGVAGAVAGAVLLASIVVAAILPNRYEAWVTLLVEPQTISSKLVEAGVAESDLNNRLHLMTMQILSRGRLSKVIDDLGLYAEESRGDDAGRGHHADAGPHPRRARAAGARDRRDAAPGHRDQHLPALLPQRQRAKVAADVANRLANDFIDEHIKERVQVVGRHGGVHRRASWSGCRASCARSRRGSRRSRTRTPAGFPRT